MIYRSKHKDGFTRIDNKLIREPKMSSSAFMLLIFMLSCSDEWEFSIKGLAYSLGWTERKTKDAVAELKKLGHIVQRLQKGEHGHFLPSAWDVYEVPVTAERKNGAPVKTSTRRVNALTGEPFHGRAVPRACGKTYPIRTNNIKELTNINKEQYGKKHALGEFSNVFLSDDEQETLFKRYGDTNTAEYIDRLSNYLNEHPEKNYKNHKATIEKWIKEDERRLAT